MPWEKSFDTDEALDRATDLFWAKGYESASLSDLIETMGINKGSLYNAYGNKNELFIKALVRYCEINQQSFLAEVKAIKDPVKSLTVFFDTVLKQAKDDKQKKGCFLCNTALELPYHDREIKKVVQESISDLEIFFYEQIEKGIEQGTIPKETAPEPVAKALMALLFGIRVLSRGTYDRKGLKAIRDQALGLIGQPV